MSSFRWGVKSGTSVTARSLRYYAQRHPEGTAVRVRFSMRELSRDGTMLNIPLYLAHRAVPLIMSVLV